VVPKKTAGIGRRLLLARAILERVASELGDGTGKLGAEVAAKLDEVPEARLLARLHIRAFRLGEFTLDVDVGEVDDRLLGVDGLVTLLEIGGVLREGGQGEGSEDSTHKDTTHWQYSCGDHSHLMDAWPPRRQTPKLAGSIDGG